MKKNSLIKLSAAFGVTLLPEVRTGKDWQINLFFRRHLKMGDGMIPGSPDNSCFQILFDQEGNEFENDEKWKEHYCGDWRRVSFGKNNFC
jgi:hypothetical protein